jgi:hypothetical protein
LKATGAPQFKSFDVAVVRCALWPSEIKLINQADNAAWGGIALSLPLVPHCGLLKRLIPQVSWSRNEVHTEIVEGRAVENSWCCCRCGNSNSWARRKRSIIAMQRILVAQLIQ